MPWIAGTATRTNGTYTGGSVWQDDAGAGVKILASNHDAHDQDVVDMVNACLHKGGQNSPTADIDWGAKRIINLADPTADQDAATKAYVDASAPDELNDVGDVTISAQAAGHVVRWSGSGWVNAQLAYGDLSGTPALATVATSGDYADLTNKPTIPADVADLGDVDLTGITDGQVMKWVTANSRFEPANDSGAGGGASNFTELGDAPSSYSGQAGKGVAVNGGATGLEFVDLFSGDYADLTNKPVLATVATSGAYADLSGAPSIPANLGDLDNVSATSPSTGHVLKWSGSEWAPAAESGGGGGTNISISRTATAVTVNSDTGSDGTISAASASYAGVLTSSLYNKLNAIESNADVTDATNVAAAGAVMDSDFSADGIMVRTGSGSYASRSISAGAGISVSNGDGDAGNPTISADYTVSSSGPSGSPSNGHVWYKV